ncbi:MAG TPA: calcium-binding protein [Oculatellaceae cyanobacterium]
MTIDIKQGPGVSNSDFQTMKQAVENAEQALGPDINNILNTLPFKIEIDQNGQSSGETEKTCTLGPQVKLFINTPDGRQTPKRMKDTAIHELGHLLAEMIQPKMPGILKQYLQDVNNSGLDDEQKDQLIMLRQPVDPKLDPNPVGGEVVPDLLDVKFGGNPDADQTNLTGRHSELHSKDLAPYFQKTIGKILDAIKTLNPHDLQVPWDLPKPGKKAPQMPSRRVEGIVSGGGGKAKGAPSYDPLVLSLDGAPISTTSMSTNNVTFDTDNTGYAHPTGWVGANDGILFLDTTGVGVLSNGSQIFGTSMPLNNGSMAPSAWAALGQFDTTSSGTINASNPVYSDLFVQTGDGSVFSLAQLGITAISLSNSSVNRTDDAGNTELSQGTFSFANGTLGVVADYQFQEDYTNSYQVGFSSSQINLLQPDATGLGVVEDLQEAEASDNSGVLQGLVNSFESTTDISAQMALLRQILINWTGSENAAYVGPHMDAESFAVVEKFYGQNLTFENNTTPGVLQAEYLYPAYDAIQEQAYGQLMFSGQLSDLSELINTEQLPDNTAYYDFSAVANSLISQSINDLTGASLRLTEFLKSVNGMDMVSQSNFANFSRLLQLESPTLYSVLESIGLNPVSTADGDTINRSGVFQNETIMASGSNDHVLAGTGNVIINAAGNNDWILTNTGNDVVNAGSNATVYLGDGNQEVTVGGGTSLISSGPLGSTAGTGNDIVHFNEGSGTVTYIQGGTGIGGVDTLAFGNDVSTSNLVLTASGNDLVIGISGTNDTLDLVSELGRSSTLGGIAKQITSFEFADGTDLTQSEFGQIGMTSSTTGNNEVVNHSTSYINEVGTVTGAGDTFYYGSGSVTVNDSGNNNVYHAGSGTFELAAGTNDQVFLSSGNAVVNAGANDYIQVGNAGTNDSILVGANDSIKLWEANTTITVNEGSGETKISANPGAYGAPTGVLTFGSGITAADLELNSFSDGLIMTLNDGLGDEVVFQNGGVGVQQFDFADGSSYTLTQLAAMHPLPDNVTTNGIDDEEALTIDETITVSASNATVGIGSGNDQISISGNNDYVGRGYAELVPGNDTITDTGTNNTIDLRFANDATESITAGANDTVTVGTGTLNFVGANNDYLEYYSNATITSGGNSQFDSWGNNSTITAGVNDTYTLVSGNDTISGAANDTFIVRGANAEITVGDNNILDLEGTATVIINAGTGTTVLNNPNANDTIQFGAGITESGMSFSSDGTDLTINLNGSDVVQLNQQFANETQYEFNNFEFADGTTETLAQLIGSSPLSVNIADSNTSVDFSGSTVMSSSVSITGSNDSIYGGQGNQTISLNGSNDNIDLGSSGFATGNDVITDGGVNNVIELGFGNSEVTLGQNDQITTEAATVDFYLGAGTVSSTINETPFDTNNYHFDGLDESALAVERTSNGSLQLNLSNGDSIGLGQTPASNDSFIFDDGTLTSNDIVALAPTFTLIATDDSTVDQSAATTNAVIQTHANDATIVEGSGDTLVNDQTLLPDWSTGSLVYSANNVVELGAGNDTTYAGINDSIIAGSGTDVIYANVGAVTVTAGTGNDTISGAAENLTLNVSSSSGNVYVSDNGTGPLGAATVNFGAGLNASDLQVSFNNNDLVLGFDDSSATVSFQNQLSASEVRPIDLNFGDGSSMSYAELQANNNFYVYNPNDGATVDESGIGWQTNLYNVGNNVTLISGTGVQDLADYGTNDTVDYSLSNANDNIRVGDNATLIIGNGDNQLNIGNNYTVTAGSGDNTINAGSNGTITVGNGDNTITDFGSTTLNVGSGNETINSGWGDTDNLGAGNATIISGGNSIVNGGAGTFNDTVGAGDQVHASQGNDTLVMGSSVGGSVNYYETTNAGATTNTDTLIFTGGITAADVSFSASTDDVDIAVSSDFEDIDLHQFGSGVTKQVTQLEFSDGTTESLADLLSGGLQVSNSNDNAVIDRSESALNETIDLFGNNDVFYGSKIGGTETFYWAGSNATIYEDNANLTVNSGYAATIYGGSGTTTVQNGTFGNTVYAGNGAVDTTNESWDTIYGGNGTLTESNGTNNYIQGGNGEIIVNGGSSETIIGGNGAMDITAGTNAWIQASVANDVYNIGSGTGTTTITQSYNGDTVQANSDVINFGAGITGGDLTISTTPANLTIAFGSDQIVINSEFDSGYKQVTQFNFADGTSENLAQLLNTDAAAFSTSDSYTYDQSSSSLSQLISLSGANDTVLTGSGNDSVYLTGNNGLVDVGSGTNLVSVASNSIVEQTAGGSSTVIAGNNDQVVGATGSLLVNVGSNDEITAATGANQINVGLGSGSTGINEVAGSGSDTISFAAGITAADLVLSATDGNLTIGLGDGTDAVTVDNEFSSGYRQFNTFEFANGATEDLSQLIQSGLNVTLNANDALLDRSSYSEHETITLAGSNDSLTTGSGNDNISVTGINDTLVLTNSNDVVTGGQGTVVSAENAVLAFTAGVNDTVNSSTANDVFNVGLGSGTTTINENTAALNGAADVINIGAGVNSSSIALSGSTTDLVIGFGSGGDQVDINGEFAAGAKQITEFHFADGTSETLAQLLQSGVTISNAFDNQTIDRTLSTASESISATGANDTILLGAGNDSVTLGTNDTLTALTGSTSVVAGTNDTINTSTANDSITVSATSGQTIINENAAPGSGSADTLVFGAGITASDLSLSGASDLVINYGSNSVQINNEFSSGYKQVTEFEFADGSSETLSQLLASGITLDINDNNDYVDQSANTGNAVIPVSGNNDTLITGSGNDTVNVSGTNDSINLTGTAIVNDTGSNNNIAGGANDFLVNVGINDTVYASSANDTIGLAEGTGLTTIDEISVDTTGTQDTLSFGAGVSISDLILSGSTNDLYLAFDGSNDAVDINGEFAQGYKQVTEFDFADGTSESLSALLASGISVTDSNDGDTIDRRGSQFNETITVSGSTDTLYTGTGNDTVSIGSFNDVIYGSTGNLAVTAGFNSTIYASSGNDTFNIGLPTENTVISETAPNNGSNTDTLVFGPDIAQNDVVASLSGTGLLLSVDSGLATVDIQGEFVTGNKQISTVEFSDGSTEDIQQLLNTSTVSSSANSSTIDRSSSTVNEMLTVNGSNDSVLLGSGSDILDLTGSTNDAVTLGSGAAAILSGGNSSFTQTSGASGISAGVNDRINIEGGTAQVIASVNDSIVGGTGALFVTYGTNDLVTASSVNDTFIVNSGIGQSILNEVVLSTSGQSDSISFGAAVSELNLSLTASSDDLLIGTGVGNDTIDINHEFAAGSKQVTQFQFADGTTESLSDLLSDGLTVTNAANNVTIDRTQSTADETIAMSGANDSLIAGGGNDTITLSSAASNDSVHLGSGTSTVTTAGNDSITAGSGAFTLTSGGNDSISTGAANATINAGINDQISTGSGNATIVATSNDTITGGTGAMSVTFGANDTVTTSTMNDYFVMDYGIGNAVINETAATAGHSDEIYFLADVNANDATYTQSGNDLIINLGNGTDTVDIKGQFASGNKQVTSIVFEDPLSLTLSQMESSGQIQNYTGTSSQPTQSSSAQTSSAVSQTSGGASSTSNTNDGLVTNPQSQSSSASQNSGNDIASSSGSSSSTPGIDLNQFIQGYNNSYASTYGPLTNDSTSTQSPATSTPTTASGTAQSSGSFSSSDINLLLQQVTAYGNSDQGAATLSQISQTQQPTVQLVATH